MKRPLCTACLFLVLCMALYVWVHPPSPLSYAEAGSEVYLTGRVYAKEYKQGEEAQVLLIYIEPERLVFQDRELPIQDNFICILEEEMPIGSRITVYGILREYEKATNPGQFSAKDYYAAKGIGGQITKGKLLLIEGRGNPLQEGLWQIKKRLGDALLSIFAKRDAALLRTMLLGDRAFLDDETKTLYKEAGILHLLAISGLHIMLLANGLLKILEKLHCPKPPAALLCAVFLLMYGLLTGMSASAVRAIFMFLLKLLAGRLKRTYDGLTAVSLCGALMLLADPYYLLQAGFLLSYGAVLSIILIKPLFTIKRSYQYPLMESFFVSLSVFILTLPIQLYFYYEVSFYGLLFNPFAVPLAGAVLFLAFLALPVCTLFPGMKGLFAVMVHGIFSAYEKGALFGEQLSGLRWNPGKPAIWQLFFFTLFTLAAILLKKYKKQYRMALLGIAVLLFTLRGKGGLTVTFLDVGQGDCICVELPDGGIWLFDGGSTSVNAVGEYRLLPFLKCKGISRLDAIFVSHGDVDHVSGIEEILESERCTVNLLVLPGGGEEGAFAKLLNLANERQIPVLYLTAGMAWQQAGVSAHCLHPSSGFAIKESNAASAVIYLTYKNFSLLLTGDVEGKGEEALLTQLKKEGIRELTVLKVAHHGSKNATGSELLYQLSPKVAVISCGRNNVYGHPHEELLKRLDEVGSLIYQTQESGAVSVRVKGGKVTVEEYFKKIY